MKRPRTWLIALAAAAPLFARATGNPIPARMENPTYVADQTFRSGGYEPAGDGVALRCTLPEAAPAAKYTRGDAAVCKKHVWQVLGLEAPWNASRAKNQAAWEGMNAAAQWAHLKSLADYFRGIDLQYKATLAAGNEVLAAFGALAAKENRTPQDAVDSGLVLAAPQNNTDAGPKVLRFAEEAKKFQLLAKTAGLEFTVLAAGPLAKADLESIRDFLKANDDVLGAHFEGLANFVDAAYRGAKDARDGKPIAAAQARVGGDLASVQEKVQAGDWDGALGEVFEGMKARGQLNEQDAAAVRTAMTGRTQVVQMSHGGKYLVREVEKQVPSPNGGTRTQKEYLFVEIKNDNLVQAAVELGDRIWQDPGVKARVAALRAAAGEVASNPGEAAREVPRNIAAEQGHLPVVSGQTKPDMKKKIEEERSGLAADAGRLQENAVEELDRLESAAKDDCKDKWKKYEFVKESAARAGTPEAAVEASEYLKNLNVLGPPELKQDGTWNTAKRDPVSCVRRPNDGANDMKEIAAAYKAAKDAVAAQYKDRIAAADAQAAVKNARIEATELIKTKRRRIHFRNQFVKMRGAFRRDNTAAKEPDFPLDAALPVNVKVSLVERYLAAVWGKQGKFYLDAWKADTPIDTEDAKDFPAQGLTDEQAKAKIALLKDAEAKDPFRNAEEDKALSALASVVPYWNSSDKDSPPPNDDKIGPEGRRYLRDNFREWNRDDQRSYERSQRPQPAPREPREPRERGGAR